jgi:chaperonin cofactor prefoldin
MIKRIVLISLIFVLGVVFVPRLTLAQSPAFLESRVNRLETENAQLRAQMYQIQSQLNQLSGRPTPPKPAPNPTSSRTRRQTLSSDPMFDRLATLVIELKERVQSLEAQVAQLKKQRR